MRFRLLRRAGSDWSSAAVSARPLTPLATRLPHARGSCPIIWLQGVAPQLLPTAIQRHAHHIRCHGERTGALVHKWSARNSHLRIVLRSPLLPDAMHQPFQVFDRKLPFSASSPEGPPLPGRMGPRLHRRVQHLHLHVRGCMIAGPVPNSETEEKKTAHRQCKFSARQAKATSPRVVCSTRGSVSSPNNDSPQWGHTSVPGARP